MPSFLRPDPKAIVGPPDGNVVIDASTRRVLIHNTWRHPRHRYSFEAGAMGMVVGLMMCAFLGFAFLPSPSLALLGPVMGLAACMTGLTCYVYTSVAGLLNVTELDLHDHVLRLSHRPAPWVGPRIIDASEVTGVIVEWVNLSQKHRRMEAWRVCAARCDGGPAVLLRMLTRADADAAAAVLASSLNVPVSVTGGRPPHWSGVREIAND